MTEEQILMSPTLERLYQLAQGCPCDVSKPEELKTALATCSVDLIYALDGNRNSF